MSKIAKVSKSPGRTRALNYFLVNESFLLVDLPGYGYAKVSKDMRKQWGKLIEAFMIGNERLRGVVHLVDCRHDPTALDVQLNDWLNENGITYQVVLTKADKLSNNQLAKSFAQAKKKLVLTVGTEPMLFSSKTGRGKNELLGWVGSVIA